MIIRSKKEGSDEIQNIFERILNFAQIYQEEEKIIVQNYFRTRNSTTFEVFKDLQREENLSLKVFPDKSKNFDQFPLRIGYDRAPVLFDNVNIHKQYQELMEVLAENLNASFNTSIFSKALYSGEDKRLDIYVTSSHHSVFHLQSKIYFELCYILALPPEYSVYELIFFLPFDKYCWIFLGVTVALTAIVWRKFEGPGSQWNFLFAVYSLLVGQFSEIHS